jgi:TonB family protein
MMILRSIIAIGMFAAVPALAQAPDPRAVQNARNWDVFLKLYPKRALEAREEGAVGFKVTIDGKGSVASCEITHSSGHPLLDQETCNLITLHAEFKPQEGLSGSQARTSEGIITWRLPDSKTKLASPTAVASNGQEKMICKKTVRTGTIAGFERTCMSQREWARQTDEERELWEEVQGKKGSTSGN